MAERNRWHPHASAVLLLMLLMALAAACSAELGQETIQLDAESSTPEPAATPTVAATSTPEPTAVPTATSVPTPTATPTPSVDEAYLELTRTAIEALVEADTLAIDNALVNEDPPFFDLAVDVVTHIDRVADTSEMTMTFSGSSWRPLLEATSGDVDDQESLAFTFAFDDRDVYLNTVPIPLDQTLPWVSMSRTSYLASQGALAGGLFVDTSAVSENLTLLLRASNPIDIIDETTGGRSLRIVSAELPNTEAFWQMPGNTVALLQDEGINPDQLSEASSVEYSFHDGKLVRVEVDFGSVFAEVVDQGASREFRTIEMLDVTMISYDQDVTVEFPAPELVERLEPEISLEPLAPRFLPSACYREQDLSSSSLPLAVPCTDSHSAETFDLRLMDSAIGEPYPGEAEVIDEAVAFCLDSFQRVTGVSADIAVFPIFYFYPIETTWDLGDREIVCFGEYSEPVNVALAEIDPARAFGLASAYRLETGDCILENSLEAAVFTLVDCDTPHYFEVYHSFDFPDGSFPGGDQVLTAANEGCVSAFEVAIGEAYAESSWTIERLFPFQESWDNLDDRLVSCFVTRFQSTERSAVTLSQG